MAATFDGGGGGGGFSVRAYAAKMRSSAASPEENCSWPFSGGGGGGGDVEKLPPMAVRKFRWWADELSRSRVAAQGPRSQRQQQRAPKKRSISELFAAAPPVADAGGQERCAQEGDDGEEEKEKVRRRRARKKSLHPAAGQIGFARKDACDNFKMSDPLDTPQSSKKSEGDKQLKNHKSKIADIQKRKPGKVKNPRKKHKLKYIQSKKGRRKPQELAKMLPLHSILKKWTRRTSVRMVKEKCNSNGGDVIKLCRESVKRVTFSGVDDILDDRKESPALKLPQLKSLCKLFSDVLASSSSSTDMSSEGDRCVSATEESRPMNGSDESIAPSTVKTHDAACVENKQSNVLLGPVDSVFSVNQNHTGDSSETSCTKEPMAGSVDLNHALPESTDLNFPYVSDPEVLHEDSDSDVQILGDRRESDLKDQPDLTEMRPPSSDKINTLQQMACQTEGNGDKSVAQTALSDLERIMDSKLAGTSFSGQENGSRIVNEEIVGLPLNSKGEFVKFHSDFHVSNTDDFQKNSAVLPVLTYAETRTSDARMKGKSACASIYQTDQPNQFSQQCRTELNFSDFRLCHECNQSHVSGSKYDPEMGLEHEIRPAVGQTMRLMGKDLTVCTSRSEPSNHEMARTDNKVATPELFLQLPREDYRYASANAIGLSHVHFGCRPQHLFARPFSGEVLVRPNSAIDALWGNPTDRTVHHRPAEHVYEHTFMDSSTFQHGSARFLPFPDHTRTQFGQNSPACSSSTIPNWLPTETLRREVQQTSWCYSDPFVIQQRCALPVDDFPVLPRFAPHVTPASHYAANFPPPYVHPPHISDSEASCCRPTSNVTSGMNNKTHDCVNFTYAHPNGTENGNSATKRPADVHGMFLQTWKKSDAKTQNDSDVLIQKSNIGMLHQRTENSAEKSEMQRSGPRKLAPGAKHILKPSQNVDEDSSPPIYSCIPFAVRSKTGSVSVCQNKSASEVCEF